MRSIPEKFVMLRAASPPLAGTDGDGERRDCGKIANQRLLRLGSGERTFERHQRTRGWWSGRRRGCRRADRMRSGQIWRQRCLRGGDTGGLRQ
uniref:Uncharacterized protein n=1 Tax=Chromera velia CCMP2878 TaxID=1169474 RepID=A0A0G4HT45_9ALVE|eukprot:Cvel_31277.t1-p1 / transcript=Cvel_31277.t1 / gene=Cvel_31277 / organism=Chromera_velia_CCMP2878 / gene_product=hypothetical protein / transcript_product=hypothetical protein / location=Cvel_scaffold4630:4718-4993(+) / protein_length=92 / sequence_SO=supercontig / SO=protein_coding / is_pseudo=false